METPRVAEICRARKLGWELIRCRTDVDTKVALDSGWGGGATKSPVSVETVLEHARDGGNYAILTGPLSGVERHDAPIPVTKRRITFKLSTV